MGFQGTKIRVWLLWILFLGVVTYIIISYDIVSARNHHSLRDPSDDSPDPEFYRKLYGDYCRPEPSSSMAGSRKRLRSLNSTDGPSDAVRGNYKADNHQGRAHSPVTLHLLPCGWTPESITLPTRQQASVSCTSPAHADSSPERSSRAQVVSTLASFSSSASTSVSGLPTVTFRSAPSDVDPSIVSVIREEDKNCLSRLIQERCVDEGRKVPRLAHYVRFGSKYVFPLDAFISVLSVARFLKPCLILLHGDVVPSGRYWRALLQLVPNVLHVPLDRPRKIFNRTIDVIEHAADVARLQVLRQYGGVYLDTDHLVLRSLDALLEQSMVLGTEVKGNKYGNGFLVAERKACFLELWIANYTDFDDSQWEKHSTVRPRLIAKDFPHLVHVVDTFFKPNYEELAALFNRKETPTYDWHRHYGVHLYTRRYQQLLFSREERIDYQDNVIGEIVRHVMYGDQHACLDKGR